MVRTTGFHPVNRGSIPLGDALFGNLHGAGSLFLLPEAELLTYARTRYTKKIQDDIQDVVLNVPFFCSAILDLVPTPANDWIAGP